MGQDVKKRRHELEYIVDLVHALVCLNEISILGLISFSSLNRQLGKLGSSHSCLQRPSVHSVHRPTMDSSREVSNCFWNQKG